MIPRDKSYSELLRFLVQSADPDDPSLPFLVGLWSYCIKHDGLTEKQAEVLKPYIAAADKKIKEIKEYYNSEHPKILN